MFRELTPLETYEELSQKSDAVLIDCRAPAEWHFTGTPDLSQIGKKPLLAAISDESGRPNLEFLEQVRQWSIRPRRSMSSAVSAAARQMHAACSPPRDTARWLMSSRGSRAAATKTAIATMSTDGSSTGCHGRRAEEPEQPGGAALGLLGPLAAIRLVPI